MSRIWSEPEIAALDRGEVWWYVVPAGAPDGRWGAARWVVRERRPRLDPHGSTEIHGPYSLRQIARDRDALPGGIPLPPPLAR